jgi:predicted negative regulator of RcsB-dependent stress response
VGKVQRLSHKQIEAVLKRDELEDFLELGINWVKKHLENVLIGVVVLALLVFGVLYLLKNRHEDSVKASLQLSSADQLFARAVSSNDSAGFDSARAGYEQVKGGFDGTNEAVAAELALANLSFVQGKYDDASAAYSLFLQNHLESPLAPLASSGLASCLEATGKIKEAADAYMTLAKKEPPTAITAQSYFDAARCFENLRDKTSLQQVAQNLDALNAQNLLPDALKSRLQALKKRL